MGGIDTDARPSELDTSSFCSFLSRDDSLADDTAFSSATAPSTVNTIFPVGVEDIDRLVVETKSTPKAEKSSRARNK